MNFGTYAFTVTWNPGGSTAYDALPGADGPVRCSIRRGRASDLETMNQGTCTLVIRDKVGTYNPANAASPLVSGGYLRPMRKLQVTVTPTGGADTPIYTGYLTRLWSEPGAADKRVTLEFVDGFWILDRSFPVIAPTGAVTAGAAISTVLTASGITAAGDKDLDAGGWLPDLRADGSVSARTIIADIARVDMGYFFCAAGGKYTYRDRSSRYARTRPAPVTTLTGTDVEQQVPGFDVDGTINEQQAQAEAWTIDGEGRLSTAPSGSLQTVADTAYLGYKQAGLPVSSPFFLNENQAYTYAEEVVARRKTGDVPTRDVRLPGLSLAQITQQVTIEIASAVTLSGLGVASEGIVESIRHEITREQHTTEYAITSRPSGFAFTVGVSTVGGADLVRY